MSKDTLNSIHSPKVKNSCSKTIQFINFSVEEFNSEQNKNKSKPKTTTLIEYYCVLC